tara:strand:+ start:71 stop:202 length:132 start_codon:yes stop_codon:yes gene_type:complete
MDFVMEKEKYKKRNTVISIHYLLDLLKSVVVVRMPHNQYRIAP